MVSLAGCGSSLPEGALPVFPVTGALTYEGQPMSGAIITFHRAKPALTARAVADASGKYVLTTYLADDGAPAGEYVVTLYWPSDKPAAQTNDPDPPLPPDRLNQVHANPATSKLRGTIREEPNTVDFKLP